MKYSTRWIAKKTVCWSNSGCIILVWCGCIFEVIHFFITTLFHLEYWLNIRIKILILVLVPYRSEINRFLQWPVDCTIFVSAALTIDKTCTQDNLVSLDFAIKCLLK